MLSFMISSYTRYASSGSFRFRSGGAAACPSKGEGLGEWIGMEWVLCVSVFGFSFFDRLGRVLKLPTCVQSANLVK